MADNEIIKNGICYMCTISCPMKIHVRNGEAVKVEWGGQGAAAPCPRWKAQLDFIYHPDRLTYPLKRIGERGSGQFARISWEEALETVCSKLQGIKDRHGAEAVAFWIAYTKEPRPYYHRLVHAFGSPNYTTESSNCASSPTVANNLTYGLKRSIAIPGIRSEPKCKIIWSSAIQNSAPTAWQANLEARKKGIKLIVVDPRRTPIASLANIHLQLRPGTDGALALGMMQVIINANLQDTEFIEKWTVGFAGLKKLVQEYTPERVEQITRVPAAKIREAAILWATAKPSQLHISTNSTTHHTNGFQNHRAIILIPAITGNIEVQDISPKKPLMNDITLHERVAKMPPGVGSQRFPIWTERYKEMQVNALADQIDSGEPYSIKALFSAGLDLQFFPNSRQFAKSLGKLDFIAVSEYFHSPGTQLADIVLPIASWWERPILMNAGNPVRLIEPAIEPVGECRSEWNIICEMAKRLGFGNLFWDGDFEKCVNHILEPSGITYQYLQQHPEGINLTPSKSKKKPGFLTASGKIEIESAVLAEHGFEPLPVYKEPAESPVSRPDLAQSYPLVLNSGARVLAYTNSQFRNIARLRRFMPEPLIDIHPVDAAERGIQSGDRVIISSPRGSIQMKARVTDIVLPGVVSLPQQWPGEANVNNLIDDKLLDPISGFPAFKSQLCQVSKA